MSAERVVEISDLRVTFRLKRSGLFGEHPEVQAVRGVDLTFLAHQTLGLVGESGCGKSTTGRAAIGLVQPTSGRVAFRDRDVVTADRAMRKLVRREMQIVFQDPYSSLDPSMSIEDSVAEPLDVHLRLPKSERRDRVRWALEQVGLRGDTFLRRLPAELSGGQRQRVAIARAIVLRPAFVVFDEAVSALDVSTKSQVIDLIQGIQSTMGASYLFISHDLATVHRVSHQIAVMYAGKIIEAGPNTRVCAAPAHPYTLALVSAIPVPDPKRERQRTRLVLTGEPPSPLHPPKGCPFHPRCAFAMDICRTETPAMTPVDGGGHVACHLQTSGPKLAGKSLARGSEDWIAAASDGTTVA